MGDIIKSNQEPLRDDYVEFSINGEGKTYASEALPCHIILIHMCVCLFLLY